MKANIGNVSLEIKVGSVKAEAMDKVIASAIKDAVYRPVAGKLFPTGKEAKGFKRDDAWSQGLQDKAVELTREVLGKLFDGVEVSGSRYVPTAKGIVLTAEEALTLAMGTDAEKAPILARLKEQGQAKSETPVAPVSEVSETVVE